MGALCSCCRNDSQGFDIEKGKRNNPGGDYGAAADEGTYEQPPGQMGGMQGGQREKWEHVQKYGQTEEYDAGESSGVDQIVTTSFTKGERTG
eukprot:CAMPEP_0178983592 /NCGR_PEP_ID=MMETSP0795-20121207/1143_1 /TAXON_ID=88552 /ORGANISM="Amoebophrya sp., Strain Ameob2" /LENGTH=91 /DNA_ID=CAMNT_0020674377 /DNA_START=200 /DNA_END=475 /DNA_ORIENTATION=-